MQSTDLLDLQLLADGGDGGDTGVTGPDAGAETAVAGAAPGGEPSNKKSFDELLKSDPDYKAEYDRKVKKAIDGRFARQRDMETRQAQLEPILDVLGGKYGISRGADGNYDLESLNKAIMDDDAYYEQEAVEKGMSVESLKRMKALERENESFRRTVAERERQEASQRAWGKVVQQAEATKQIYPAFDLEGEMANPEFGRLVAAGVPVRTAFEVVHRDEVIGGAIQYTAQQTMQKAANAVKAGSLRPVENGLQAGNAASTKLDPRNLTKEQRADIKNRVLRGETVTFD